MQVFNLRLGKSALDSEKREYPIEELEDQLGEALLKQYPISSQLIVQNKNCPLNKAWRINREISLPRSAHEFWRHMANFQKSSLEGPVDISGLGAVLRTEKCGEELLGVFTGHITHLEVFVAVLGRELKVDTVMCSLDEYWICELRETEKVDTNYIPIRTQLGWLQRRFETPVILLPERIRSPESNSS